VIWNPGSRQSQPDYRQSDALRYTLEALPMVIAAAVLAIAAPQKTITETSS
jgi:hypothetical protein